MLNNISSNPRSAYPSSTTENRIGATATTNRAAEQNVVPHSSGMARPPSPRSLFVSPHYAEVTALQEALARGNAQKVAHCYTALRDELAPEERVTLYINGTAGSLHRKDCYVAALVRDANHANAFCNLGTTLGPNERIDVTLNGGAPQSFSEKDCYLAALARDANCATAFNNLGATLGPNERIDVILNGGPPQSFSQKDCYLAAPARDANDVYAFYNLGMSLRKDEKIYINGVEHTKIDCVQRALTSTGLTEFFINRAHEELAILTAAQSPLPVTITTSPIAVPAKAVAPPPPDESNPIPSETRTRHQLNPTSRTAACASRQLPRTNHQYPRVLPRV